ncbi:putative B3 domain-containing protein Os03g0621600 [Punica granatum]|uniref:Uncharacterized protein n=2 Tax=Punica granatum TaxID=22663 RepID=A0A2I0IWT3_PUNGR|nr:putative B3 domain-containing protein Os03g0621600 [Punica granatum]PKI48444.1 hypothetical protein CRG98_031170 [Punica granatum]
MGRQPSKPKKKMITRPYFFKVLIGDFSTKLRVPPAFVKNFKETLPTKVLLKSDYVGQLSWYVKMKKTKSGCYFTDGWPKIVRDLELKLGDFLVFRLVNEGTLKAVVFDRTCCEKKIHIRSKRDGGDDHKGNVMEGEDIKRRHADSPEEDGKGAAAGAPASPSSSSKKAPPRLEKPLVKHEMRCLSIPTRVANEARQWTRESAVIRGSNGRKWRVVIKLRTKGYRRLDFSTGWSSFIRDNGLSPGDTLRLDFKGGRDNLIEAEVL